MSSRVTNKTYIAKIKQDYDVKEGYFQYIEIPDELLHELGWKEGDNLDFSMKMGNNSNVIVVSKA